MNVAAGGLVLSLGIHFRQWYDRTLSHWYLCLHVIDVPYHLRHCIERFR